MRSLVYIQTLMRTAKLFSILWFMLFVALHTAFAQEVRYNYDAAGRLVGVVDAQGRTLIYDYDALGNLLGVRRQDTVGQVAITLVTPDKGFIGTQVQIFGVGFSAVANQNAISFNGFPAIVLAATTTSLTTEVPIGATTGFIAVKTPLGSATSPQPFTVLGGITVSPSKINLARGSSQQFTATVTGTDDQRVVWSVNGIDGGSSSVGIITPEGLYTAPFISALSLTVTIKATSLAYPEFPDFSATASVTVVATCSVTWTGAGGNSLWQNSANWSTKVLPGASDDVCIGAGVNVTLSSGAQTIRSLTSDSALSIPTASLSIANTSTINHNFTLSGGTLSGAGSLTISGLTTWSGGAMTGTGTTTLNGNVNISGNNFHDLSGGRTLNTTATTTMIGGFNDFFRTGGGASINNSGLWQDQSTSSMQIANAFGGAQSTFRNAGTYRKSGGGGTTTIAITFNNTSSGAGTGVVEVLNGVLNLTGGGTANSGSTFTGATGTALGFGGGTHSLQIGSSVSGATVSFGGGTANINGTYSAAATSVSGNAVVNFNPGATVIGVGAVTISTGTATFNTGSLIAPTALTLSGALAGADPVTVSGLTTWTGGTMTGTGTTTLNGNLNISGNASHDLIGGRTLNTTATTTTSGGFTGFFRAGGGASINNSGVWQDQFTGSSTISNDFGGTQSTFRNTGVYRKSGGSATTTIGIAFNNTNSSAGTGVVEVLSGSLNLTGGGTANSGSTFTGTTGTVLGFGGGTYLLEIGSSVSGATVSFGDGTANINGTYSATATSVVGRAIVNFNPGATITSVGALTIGSGFGGTANFNTGSLITPTTLTLIGALTGSDPVTVSGLTTWTGGTMSGTGTTTLNGNVTISGNNFHDLTGGRTLNTTATTTMSGGFTGFFRTGGGASINNSGVWQDQFTGSSTISNDFGGTQSTFRNTGTYKKSVGSATTTIGLIFNSSGTVDIQSGTLRFTGGYTQTAGETRLNGGALSSTTTLNIQGGRLVGAGTVTANVSNAGQVSPGASPGILNITGTYTQTSTGTLNIEIGGLTAGTQYDRLAISGAATLSGTLKIDLIGGFAPSPGNTFQIMTFSSHSGTFTTTNVPGFVVNVNATNVTAAAP